MKVWPDCRSTVDLGEIAVIKALDTKKLENECLFLPTNVTSGTSASDFPLINTRTEVYAESFGRRTK
jgi:catalase